MATHTFRTLHPASRERELMEKKDPNLAPDIDNVSDAEWSLLRVLWTEKTATARHLSELLFDQRSWSGSTVKTLLARLEKKGIVRAERENNVRGYVYHPLISEEDAARARAHLLFANMCAKRRGGVLIELASTLPLTKADITLLQQTLEERKETAPTSIACDCERQHD